MRTNLELGATPSGYRLLVWRSVDAPAERVWDIFRDTARWSAWGPSLTAVEASDRHIVSGTTGRVRTVFGVWLPFTVQTVTATRWTWTVAGIPATGHRVEARDAGCRAGFEVPLIVAPYVLVCWLALRAIEDLATADD